MQRRSGETWQFEVRCPGADRVYLVREAEGGATAWIEMQPSDPGRWAVQHHLAPGRYRFRYFRAEGSTFLNCGNYGLTASRLGDDEPDPSVQVEPLEYAAVLV